MLLHPRTPVIVGSVGVFALIWVLAKYSPSPGSVSVAHAKALGGDSLSTCQTCHTDTGVSDGCLSCHNEISDQLHGQTGYHHFLAEQGHTDCTECHDEHSGESFHLVNEKAWGAQVARAFRHPHTEFDLHSAHESLACESCHIQHLEEAFSLEKFPAVPRSRTFLGLVQECGACHDDVHAGGIETDCGSCHGQQDFHLSQKFDHSRHLPLLGGHEGLDCDSCHLFPNVDPVLASQSPMAALPYPFEETKGSGCFQCHESPHHTLDGEACDNCHPAADHLWSMARQCVTEVQLEATGFRLEGPHEGLACGKCHPTDVSFEKRYRDPETPGYRRHEDTCSGCHEDVHGGQFNGRYSRCIDCHSKEEFRPAKLTIADHTSAFPLIGAHASVACTECHQPDAFTGVRQFVDTKSDCRTCHQSPHAGQFADRIAKEDCVSCHSPRCDTFRIMEFDHGLQTGYFLNGAHASAACEHCHYEVPTPSPVGPIPTRRFAGTPKTCASCHVDPHRGQFKEYGIGQCNQCHVSNSDWHRNDFDHDTDSRFPLVGAHVGLECSSCHLPIRLGDGSEIIQYKPMGTECRDCHEVPESR